MKNDSIVCILMVRRSIFSPSHFLLFMSKREQGLGTWRGGVSRGTLEPMYGNLGGQVVNEREFTDDLTSHINLFKITYLPRLTTTTLTLHDCSLAIHVFSNFCATCLGDSSQSTCEYGE